ncbi:MAG: 4Fe-4S dicluster domain-containing protein, partial [Deltaproteobacteria bacterium]|nr:4Fe-4S dicluster domain-containing protein [Deltaproteobacteria bacterium]
MKNRQQPSCFVRFDKNLCHGHASCVRACPTKAIRMIDKKKIQLVDQCIGCGECIRICDAGAVSPAAAGTGDLGRDQVSIALVSPVLYAQFPGVMPKDTLMGLRQMGFRHTIDMSYFLEIFHYATEEFIKRNRESNKAPWPLISPVCPVVVRLIAFQFPSLLPNVLPVLRPVALLAREVKRHIIPYYQETGDRVALYYINPCPTKMAPICSNSNSQQSIPEIALGINEVFPELAGHVEQIKESDVIPFHETRFEYETCATGNASLWGMSGGEIADMDIDRSLAVSGLEETISYLQKIELGLFKDIEYIEFRTCREGCLGGVLTAIDKYRAKSAVQKMVKLFGLGRRLPRENVLRMYEKGKFQTEKSPAKLINLYGTQKEPLSFESLQEIEKLMELLKGTDCAACGAPDCRTFAEDVVRGRAPLKNCLWLGTRYNIKRKKGKGTMTVKDLVARFGLQVVAGKKGLDRQVEGGYCGDLLSEIMANAPEGCVWLTIQGHQNIVAVAVLREMAAIIITGGQSPD